MNRPADGLDRVMETMLTPLWARAHARDVVPELGFDDPFARALLDRVEVDTDRVLTDHGNVAGTIHRTITLDDIVRAFVDVHPEAVVITAGCGLCARDRRLGPEVGDDVTWIGVDAGPVLAWRRTLVPDDPSTLVEASVAAPGWLRAVPVAGRPTLVLAEGVLMYLGDDEVRHFLTSVATLPNGSQIGADVFHPRIARSGRHPIVKATGAEFRSGVRDGAELAGLVPGLELVAEHDVMERIGRPHRLAARAFRLATRGGRAYHVAQLRVTGP